MIDRPEHPSRRPIRREAPQRARVLTEVIAVRIEPALYGRIEAAAIAEGRTLSGWMRQMAIERLNGRPA